MFKIKKIKSDTKLQELSRKSHRNSDEIENNAFNISISNAQHCLYMSQPKYAIVFQINQINP